MTKFFLPNEYGQIPYTHVARLAEFVAVKAFKRFLFLVYTTVNVKNHMLTKYCESFLILKISFVRRTKRRYYWHVWILILSWSIHKSVAFTHKVLRPLLSSELIFKKYNDNKETQKITYVKKTYSLSLCFVKLVVIPPT